MPSQEIGLGNVCEMTYFVSSGTYLNSVNQYSAVSDCANTGYGEDAQQYVDRRVQQRNTPVWQRLYGLSTGQASAVECVTDCVQLDKAQCWSAVFVKWNYKRDYGHKTHFFRVTVVSTSCIIFGIQHMLLICNIRVIDLPISLAYCCYTFLGRQFKWIMI